VRGIFSSRTEAEEFNPSAPCRKLRVHTRPAEEFPLTTVFFTPLGILIDRIFSPEHDSEFQSPPL